MKQLVGFLLLVGLVLTYWQWVVALVVLVLIVKAAPIAWRELQGERAEARRGAAKIAWRADVEDAMYVRGDDERGVYGRWNGCDLQES